MGGCERMHKRLSMGWVHESVRGCMRHGLGRIHESARDRESLQEKMSDSCSIGRESLW